MRSLPLRLSQEPPLEAVSELPSAALLPRAAAADRVRCLRGGADELVTSLLACLACLGADAAVRHVHPLGVSLALVAAASARLHARVKKRPG